jgi:hypothetical protein
MAKVNVLKVVDFTGTIRKFLSTFAVPIEGTSYPPICLSNTLFHGNVLLKKSEPQYTQFSSSSSYSNFFSRRLSAL